MCALEPPFQGENLVHLGQCITTRKPKPIPIQYSPKLRDLIERMLLKDARQRVSAKQALSLLPVFKE